MSSEFRDAPNPDSRPDLGLEHPADAVGSELCDSPPSAVELELDAAARERIAGLQFLHALLERVERPAPAELETRIQRVVAGIRPGASHTPRPLSAAGFGGALLDERDQRPANSAPAGAEPAVSRRRPGSACFEDAAAAAERRRARVRRRPWIARGVLAASVVLAVAICWTQFAGGNRAYAAVAGALETASRLQDRTYRILALVRGPLGRDKEVESSVAVRGGRAFALRHPSLLFNGEVWFGRRENEFWFVPTVGPVIASEDPAWSRDVLSEMQISTPYLQVTSVLAPMKDLYRLEDLPSEELPTVAGGAERQFFRRVRGTLLDDDSRLPQSIDLWLEPRTKLARRLLLVWEAGTGPAGIQQVTFDLASTDPLPDNWYEHSSHHDASRIVIHKP